MLHHSGQNLFWTRLAVPREYTTTMMTHTVVDKSTDNATPHFVLVKCLTEFDQTDNARVLQYKNGRFHVA